jgi:hypothetical protein
MAKLFKVFVELYELLLTTQKDDRSGRVVSTGSLKIDDLIQIALSQQVAATSRSRLKHTV